MLFRKCMTHSVKFRKIITESSADSPRAMFAKLRHKFLQEDTNTISTIRMELNLCRQGPEDELADFLGKMDANYARLKDLGTEARDRDTRVALTTQMNASLRELAKHHTTRSPGTKYHQLCADFFDG